MSEKELQEIIQDLRDAGFDPKLCDVAVPLCTCAAQCGKPTEFGDDDHTEYIMMPRSMCSELDYFVPAAGDSMIDAGIEPGDRLQVRTGIAPRDGDIVVACIDGCGTVKAFFTDENGTQWLVPQNKNYDPIMLNESMNMQLLGVVVGFEKSIPRVPTRVMIKAIKEHIRREKMAHPEGPDMPLPDEPEDSFRNVFLENRTRHITQESSRSRVASVFASGHSKKEILESLFPLQNKYIDLLSLSEEDRVSWLNLQPSQFVGSFRTTDLKYFRDQPDEPNRRSRPPKTTR